MSGFPETLYKVPGLHRGQNGETFSYIGVNDEAEMLAALADGWFLDMSDAIAGASKASTVIKEVIEAQEAIDDVSPATRDELEQKAKELGIGFNARTSDTVLAQRIAGAI